MIKQCFDVVPSTPLFGHDPVLQFRTDDGKSYGVPCGLNCEAGDRIAVIDAAGLDIPPDSPVLDALRGARGADQRRIAEVGMAWLETILRKNTDYGSSVWKVPLLAPAMDAGDAILVRMTDKVHRIGSLKKRPAEVVTESLDDTITDLGAYCLLYLARPKPEQWVSPTEIDSYDA